MGAGDNVALLDSEKKFDGVDDSVGRGVAEWKVDPVGGTAVGVATPSKEPDGMREGVIPDVTLFTPGVCV